MSRSKKNYIKPPKTYQELVTIWQSRNLNISDIQKAGKCFHEISYYRLSAYALPFQKIKDVFNEGTSFENIINLYCFDRELRLVIFDVIERIEVSIRTQIIYQLSHKYGSHWQDNPKIFVPAYRNKLSRIVDVFAETQKIIRENCTANHPEVFIKHYNENYSSPINPPSWMCMELLTIGQLSRVYKGLANNSDKGNIASFFGLHYSVFQSWLHTLVYVRNICAHHSRLWNRDFAIKPDILLKPQHPWISKAFNNNHRTFYFLCILKYLLHSANPHNSFKEKFTRLTIKYSEIPIQYMGIPSGVNGKMLIWQHEPLWQN